VAKPENSFIAWVHKYLPPEIYHMKNHNEYTGGVFDVWYDGPTADLWVEYKFITLPKRASTMIVPDLSALQLQWGLDRVANGRNVRLIIGCKEGGAILPVTYWDVGITMELFMKGIQSRQALARYIHQSCSALPRPR
jgi:hypothetical protein